jgi:uncharacterized protein (DUF488 family)
MTETIFTIGHSSHELDHFVDLLKLHKVSTVCDVRSKPYSRRNPQFNSGELKNFLFGNGISYVFLGRELGARSEDPSCYVDGKVEYERLAKTELFRTGLQWVREHISKSRLVLMCAEKDPLECHRTILVSRSLSALGIAVDHILENGQLESQASLLQRLLSRFYKDHETDLFRSRDEIIQDAFAIQSARIAFEANEEDRALETWSHFG